MPTAPTPSQASQLPPLIFSAVLNCAPFPSSCAKKMWERSSLSEAAMAVGQATYMPTAPPLSQASQLPPLIFSAILNCAPFPSPCAKKCGSARALARPRWRWARQHECRHHRHLRRHPSSHIAIAGRQLDKRWLSGRLREQARSHRLIARPPPMRQKKSSNGRPVATPAIPAYVPSHAVFLLSLALRPSRNQETTCPRLHALPYLS